MGKSATLNATVAEILKEEGSLSKTRLKKAVKKRMGTSYDKSDFKAALKACVEGGKVRLLEDEGAYEYIPSKKRKLASISAARPASSASSEPAAENFDAPSSTESLDRKSVV